LCVLLLRDQALGLDLEAISALSSDYVELLQQKRTAKRRARICSE